MTDKGLGDHHLLERRALLADLEIAVAVGPFEVVVQFFMKLLPLGLAKSDLFGEDEDAARSEPRMDAPYQRQTLRRGDELQGEVENDYRGVLNRDLLEIGTDHRHRNGRHGIASQELTAALDHRRGVIDRDNVTVRLSDPLAHGEANRPEGTAEIIAVTPGLGVFRGEDADIGYDHPVAGDRALNHVGKDRDDPFIELKIDHFLQGRGIDGIGFFGHGLLVLLKLAVR